MDLSSEEPGDLEGAAAKLRQRAGEWDDRAAAAGDRAEAVHQLAQRFEDRAAELRANLARWAEVFHAARARGLDHTAAMHAANEDAARPREALDLDPDEASCNL